MTLIYQVIKLSRSPKLYLIWKFLGTEFTNDHPIHHYWNAVCLEGNWRIVDPTCGAGIE